MSEPHEDDWMTVSEVASRAGRTRQWVHHRLADGTFKHERKGRRIDVDGSSVHQWMLIERMRLERRVQQLTLNMPYK